MTINDFILLEDRTALASEHPGTWFEDAVDEVICEDPALLQATLCKLDELRKTGYYLVGFLSYEAGYVIQSLVNPYFLTQAAVPLLYFQVFKTCKRLSAFEIETRLSGLTLNESCLIHNLRFKTDKKSYHTAFTAIQKYLRAGDSYQVNFTSAYHFNYEGSPIKLYRALREKQKVQYSGIMQFRNQHLLSLSPELFFSKKGSKIITKPMKGTMPRSMDKEEDHANAVFLKTDLKSIAENMMIVDLLRNDLSMIAQPGSVCVPRLFDIESYETVHQMVSTVEGIVDTEISVMEIMRCLFPCGSITGAPKRRTMSIIADLENKPRGIYTGAFGYITPENDMCFNVAIRTLHLKNGHGELGLGGGLLVDSNEADEFEEMQLKGRFFTQLENICL